MTASATARRRTRTSAGGGVPGPSITELEQRRKATLSEPEHEKITDDEPLEEVTIEPDLPIEEPPVQTPPEAPPADDPDTELSAEKQAQAEMVAFLNLSDVDKGAAEYYARVAAMDPSEPVYVAGNRAPRLKVGNYVLKPGEIVPGAHAWQRREAYERLGRIERR